MLLASWARRTILPAPCPHHAARAGLQALHPSGIAQSRLCVAQAGGDGGAAAKTPLKYNLRPLTKDDVVCSFARSGGAGGQNVNKVNTKVDMRFELDKQSWIPDEVKEEIRRAEKNRFTKEGVLVLQSQKHRTQAQNIDDALTKLQDVVDAAVIAVTPKEIDPETIKRVKASIKAGQERRLQDKKKDSARKQDRRSRDFD